MATYTIELSEYQGTSGNSNGEWFNNFNNQLSIENGDVIQIKQALINTSSPSVQNINVEKDTNIKITFGLYDQAVSNANTCDLKLLPSDMQNNDNNPFSYRYELFLNNIAGYIQSRGLSTVINESSYNTPWICFNKKIGNKGFELATIDVNILILKGSYDPSNLADIISKELQQQKTTIINSGGVPSVYFCLPSYYPTLIARNTSDFVIEDNQYLYFYINHANVNFFNYIIGSPSVALLFQDQKYKFSNLHMPLLLNPNGNSASAPYTEIGSSVYQVEGLTNYFSRYSGLYLYNLEVVNGDNTFWNSLGFSKDFQFINQTDLSNLESLTTTAFVNTDDIDNKNYSLPLYIFNASGGVSQWNHFINSDISTTVDGDQNYVSDDSGYYLINVISSFNTNYITQTSNYSKISCIVSKNYVNGDYISVYSESSIVYQHYGEPIFLSQFQIQILEPKTKLISNNLGNNSTIFLELVKQNRPNFKQLEVPNNSSAK